MSELTDTFVIEVAWEVCNKIGGLHTALSSKAAHAVNHFHDNYLFIGPYQTRNTDFEETDEPEWRPYREALRRLQLECHFGRWNVTSRPRVILVAAGKKYNKDQILYHLWEEHGVDSIDGGSDYVEAVLFATAVGEVITALVASSNNPVGKASQVLAHFHEWNTGAGLLHLAKHAPAVATLFSNRKTVLGWTMVEAGRDLYAELDELSPSAEARHYNVMAKHSLQQATARAADLLSTVSELSLQETTRLLGIRPGKVVGDGLNCEEIALDSADGKSAGEARDKLLTFARQFTGNKLPGTTRTAMIAGRYEFVNKGIDVLLEALHAWRTERKSAPPLLVYLFVTAPHLEFRSESERRREQQPLICTHRLVDENNDPILATAQRLQLTNQPGAPVQLIFVPIYLSEADGLFNLPYSALLAGMDLAVFPAKYEPWGYAPLECAAHGIPTITSDLAGFGDWVVGRLHDGDGGIRILRRRKRAQAEVVQELRGMLSEFMAWSAQQLQRSRDAARHAAEQASWTHFYPHQLDAYQQCLNQALSRRQQLQAIEVGQVAPRSSAAESMFPHFRTFAVETVMPPKLNRLRELAYNLWWSWNPDAAEMFARIDPYIWDQCGHNPVYLLEQAPNERLQELAGNDHFRHAYATVLQAYDAYMRDTRRPPGIEDCSQISREHPIAYFSTEFGIHESLPIYSGGLGVLSGDHLKSASDMNVPLIGVGLLYKFGYFSQKIDRDGNQIAEYIENDFGRLPVRSVQNGLGSPLVVQVDMPGRALYVNVWEVQVGRIKLYLLDSDLPGNTLADRDITGKLYVGDERKRFEQEFLLGVGGARMLRELGVEPAVIHLNEGHSAFLIFEQIRYAMVAEQLSFDAARELVRSQIAFTTHTPVQAGNERFPNELIQHYFSHFSSELNLPVERILELGHLASDGQQAFIMTILALKVSYRANGVSELHGRVSRRMWDKVWPALHRSMVPISHITNGIHVASFIGPEMRALLETYLGLEWQADIMDEQRWQRLDAVPDYVLWDAKNEMKQRLMNMLRDLVAARWQDGLGGELSREDVLARIRTSALTIGFARRFAPYKRATLLLHDLDRLDQLVNNPRRPVQIVFAGKAHPRDEPGKQLVRQVVALCRDPRFAGRILFVEDYDLRVAKYLVQGVDVWLNTPTRPHEASGTSGQKAAANGTLNLSVADGWWCEAADGSNGWTIGPGPDQVDEETVSNDFQEIQHLYSLLEDAVIPQFYQRNERGLPEGWIQMMRRSLQSITPVFNTHRMVMDYYNQMYVPCARRYEHLRSDNSAVARSLSDWKRRVANRFGSVHIRNIATTGLVGGTLQVGVPLTVSVEIDNGDLAPEELMVELVVGRSDPRRQIRDAHIVPLQLADGSNGEVRRYQGSFKPSEKGAYAYGVRVAPIHAELSGKHEVGLGIWA